MKNNNADVVLEVNALSRGRFGYGFLKRLVDFCLGAVLLFATAPIFLFAATLICLESTGNPFFIQERIGLRGRPFKLIKLRGMYVDSRQRFPEMYEYSDKLNLDFHFHVERDPRVTKVGSFMRRTSIDELPNFINVVLGDMSLVGPRPEIPELIPHYGCYAEKYLSVKPGVTCVSKCTGRDKLTKMDSIKLDLNYIDNQSISLDIKILWRTFLNVVCRKDVH